MLRKTYNMNEGTDEKNEIKKSLLLHICMSMNEWIVGLLWWWWWWERYDVGWEKKINLCNFECIYTNMQQSKWMSDCEKWIKNCWWNGNEI